MLSSGAERVVVIGSGPSGAMAARQLLRRGVPVTMLESGRAAPEGFLLRLFDRNLVRQLPEPERIVMAEEGVADRRTLWIRSMMLGGLTNQWTGAVPRFAAADFVEGEQLHERYRWPIRYEDLQPYYDDAERLIGVSGQATDAPNLPAGRIAHHRRLPDDWQPV
ncbi:MAG: FAD-dependent monooxygenase, partial [Gemmatimonadaceae bacterium]